MKEISMDGKYLYGFVQTSSAIQFDITGMDQEMLYTIPHRDIAAVVSNALPFAWSDFSRETVFSYLTTHQAAIEAIMEKKQIIPAKFGTYLSNEKLVRTLLETEYNSIRSSLAGMANRIELDVVVLWRDPAGLFKKIAEMPELDDIKRQIAEAESEQRRNLQIHAGKQVKAILDKMNAACAKETIDALKPFSLASQFHEVKDDEMILNCAFLLETHQLGAFETQINALDKRYDNHLTFRMIGPLPPYSFSTLEIERLDPDEIEQARLLFSLGNTSTELEIKVRYREMAKTLHPDRFPEDRTAQNRFELFNKAYEILKTYCRSFVCSFEPADIENWIAVRPMKYTAGTR